ncbi:MAG: 3-dehydroquinate synthase II [Thermoplasmata archaeon]|nr:3-dehydroquinate synthase II [Thermoplasmata archaeon]
MSLDRIVVALSSPEPEVNHSILSRARRRGFRRFTSVDAPGLPPQPGEVWYRSTPDGFQELIGDSPSRSPVVRLYRVRGPGELAPVVEALTRGEASAVRWGGERVIPLETLVAARSARMTLWVVTAEPSEIPAFLGALEHGADTVVVEVSATETVDLIERRLEQLPATLQWERIPVRAVTPAGTGDRVIVDTTSLLEPEEGILVGSAAAFLYHVASEAVGSRYTRPRPFRVNAGAAHLYTLLANGETRYLSELVPGDSILVGSPRGASRSVRVGRIKIERRPLLLIEGEFQNRRYTVFLQEAETVRLTTDVAPVATTDLQPGATVWGVTLPAGRHLGVAVEEKIDER